MSKVSVIGVGNVGATCANVLAGHRRNERLQGHCRFRCSGCDFRNAPQARYVQGRPHRNKRTNAKIVSEVVGNIVKFSPNAFIVMVSNPMDTMTYLAYKTCDIKKNHLIGMGGALDSSRFNYYLSKALNAPVCDIDGMVIGAHGDATMVPLMSSVKYKGGDVEKILSKAKREQVIADTMVGGATITKLMGTSAFYAPGACAASIVRAILHDEKRIIPCSVPQNGEYGEEDICLGVPIIIGRKGVEKIVRIKLSEDEKKRFHEGAEKQRNTNKILHDLGLI